jgi:hypothetical protein
MTTPLLSRSLLLAACLISLPTLAIRSHPLSRKPPMIRFREHLIDHFPAGYQCAVADINGDGKPDILALSSGKSEIAWYENPTWKKHLLTTATHSNIDLAAYDMDGDGKLEMAVASEFDLGNSHTGGKLQWFKRGKEVTEEWTEHEFASIPTAHRIRWADFDGNGKKELVVVPILGEGAVQPNYTVPAPIVSYSFQDGKAVARPIDSSLTVVHGVHVVDFDGDGKDDLLLAGFEGVFWLKPTGTGDHRTWKKVQLGAGEQNTPPKRGSSEVDLGHLPDGKRFLATIEPWHGHEVVVYTPPASGKGLWERHIIDDTFDDGHALACVDLDGDGKSEIVAGYRGKGRSLYGYRCTDDKGLKWERFTIDAGDMAASGLFIADINGDGRPDIVCIGAGSNNIKWYENLGQ